MHVQCTVKKCPLLRAMRTSYAGTEFGAGSGSIPGCGNKCIIGDTFNHPLGPACRMSIDKRTDAYKPCDIPLFDGEMIKHRYVDQVNPTFVINSVDKLSSTKDHGGRFVFDIPPEHVRLNPDEIKVEFRVRLVTPDYMHEFQMEFNFLY